MSAASGIVGYFALVGLMYLVFWKWGARRFASRKISNPGTVDANQLKRELGNTLLTMLFSSLVPVLLMPVVIDREPLHEPWQLAVLFVALLILNDVWFYISHRRLHSPWLFKHVHSTHHRSVAVNPFTSYSFHPAEGLLLTLWVIPVLLFVPVPLPLLGAMQMVGLFNNVNAHLGYELQPKWFVRVPPFSWLTSSTFHNLHHAHVTGNYGLMLRVWDRVFGTERTDYVERFVERGEKEAARPTAP